MTTFNTDTSPQSNRDHSPLRRFANRIWTRTLECRERQVHSAALSSLKSRDLKDIGLIDHDISSAKNLPLSTDAATDLRRISLGRSGNW